MALTDIDLQLREVKLTPPDMPELPEGYRWRITGQDDYWDYYALTLQKFVKRKYFGDGWVIVRDVSFHNWDWELETAQEFCNTMAVNMLKELEVRERRRREFKVVMDDINSDKG